MTVYITISLNFQGLEKKIVHILRHFVFLFILTLKINKNRFLQKNGTNVVTVQSIVPYFGS